MALKADITGGNPVILVVPPPALLNDRFWEYHRTG